MKKEIFMTIAAVGMFAGLSANQPAAPAQAQQQEKSATSLTADELAFAAKLNDQNRKVFSTQFSAKQRKDAMDAASCQASAGSCATSQKAVVAPNDAVAKVTKEIAPAVADKKAVVVEKKEAAASSAKSAPQAK
ncbi:MAG: hypothetical protein ACHQT8_03805 [Chlamydiales bacterium]